MAHAEGRPRRLERCLERHEDGRVRARRQPLIRDNQGQLGAIRGNQIPIQNESTELNQGQLGAIRGNQSPIQNESTELKMKQMQSDVIRRNHRGVVLE